MSFDVSVTHEDRWTRLRAAGDSHLGRLLSLLQVLEIDSAAWPHEAVLLDLRELRPPLSADDRANFARAAARALPRMKRIALVAAPPWQEVPGMRCFERDADVVRWLAQD